MSIIKFVNIKFSSVRINIFLFTISINLVFYLNYLKMYNNVTLTSSDYIEYMSSVNTLILLILPLFLIFFNSLPGLSISEIVTYRSRTLYVYYNFCKILLSFFIFGTTLITVFVINRGFMHNKNALDSLFIMYSLITFEGFLIVILINQIVDALFNIPILSFIVTYTLIFIDSYILNQKFQLSLFWKSTFGSIYSNSIFFDVFNQCILSGITILLGCIYYYVILRKDFIN